ncbi:STAS domain-containing protein [Paenibacillus allorhizosphaerae]|uniref:Anti-sigma F factor antagonist n=1 Tax=Paenibacillus allorhizosphaerae TaxID=2849866 RepID=A0ABM8VJL6_9BACL|nr:STAS domain-containing protein [Paenibacillus allorhizosphaerae]CAG7645671.1 Anti-sigma F factor antagonist [Paenibacillus allorhizosphaerae]
MKLDAQKFHVKVLSTPEAHIVFMTGELDLGTAELFQSAVETIAAQKDVPLKLNMRELTYIDSTGIGIIVTLLKQRQDSNGLITAQEVPPKIRRLFDMTGLSQFLTVEGGGG